MKQALQRENSEATRRNRIRVTPPFGMLGFCEKPAICRKARKVFEIRQISELLDRTSGQSFSGEYRQINQPGTLPPLRGRGVRAFTLAELLVVMSIIAVLAALLLPAMSQAKSKALSTSCKNHLRQMGLAMQMYVDDSRGLYPCWWNFQEGGTAAPWAVVLAPYTKLKWEEKAYHCPAYQGQIVVPTNVPIYNAEEVALWGSYSYNKGGTEVFGGGWDEGIAAGGIFSQPAGDFLLGLSGEGGFGGGEAPAISEAQIQFPSEMFAVSDSRVGPWQPGSNLFYGRDFMVLGVDSAEVQAPRHSKDSNFLYCDGHVTPIRFADSINPRKTALYYNNDHQAHRETWQLIQLP